MRTGDGLNEEYIGAAHAFLVARVDLAIGKRLELDVAQRHAELPGNLLGEFGIHRTAKQHQVLFHLGHVLLLPCHVGASSASCAIHLRIQFYYRATLNKKGAADANRKNLA